MATWSEVQRQYDNRFDEHCKNCGLANLFRKIEWADGQNEETRRRLPGHIAEQFDGYILIKYCHDCGQKRKNAYHSDNT